MTNAARHSGARTCTVRIALNAGLDLEITDDGRGLPRDFHPGVGVNSMRERAQELGGRFTIDRAAPAMIALLSVEWRRALARRLVWVSAALAVLAILVGATIAFLVSRDADQASVAQAQAARQADVQRCITGQLQGVPAEVPPEERPRFCEEGFIPPVQDRRFHYEQLPNVLVWMSPFAISLGWLLGPRWPVSSGMPAPWPPC
jgi:hypothetical protein